MNAPAPFELECPPQFAELLSNLNISLAVSTYQAGKVVLISPYNNDKTVQLPRTFPSAMGMAVRGNSLAIAAKNSVEVLEASEKLAVGYPAKPGVYDCIYMPRTTYHTSSLMLHDMAFINENLVAVNTLFSTLCHIDSRQSFTPFWQPPFISELMPEDRCHLNGMAIDNNEIKYLTALGSVNTVQGWRDNKMNGGILMEYPSGKIILDSLAMPHSPRLYDGNLYVLNSAQGELILVNPENGTYEVMVQLGGFARGMDRIGDYVFIGVSKLRHNNETFASLPIAKTSFAGILAVHLPTRTIVAKAEYKMSVEEIYDVKVLPGKLRPNILSPDMDVHKQAIIVNGLAFWSEAEEKKPDNNNTASNEAAYKNHEQESIQLQVMKKISPQKLNELFGNMICKDLGTAIKNNLTSDNLNLIVASIKMNPVAVIVFEAQANKTARIWSVFVKSDQRRKGLASFLLSKLQDILQQNDILYTEAIFTHENIDENIASKLAAKFTNINLQLEE